MPKNKKPPRKYEKKPYESTGISSDTSANIYMSMMLSPAWQDLTGNQKALYITCKAQLYAMKERERFAAGIKLPEQFTMNQSKWEKMYHLYKRGNYGQFYKDMDALVAHGFIDCVQCGANTRTKSVYQYSDRWQKWGHPDFSTPNEVKTSSMLRKERGGKDDK